MITGNTVKRLSSGISPGQSEAEPETENKNPINRPPNQIETVRPITNRDNQRSEERLPFHQTLD